MSKKNIFNLPKFSAWCFVLVFLAFSYGCSTVTIIPDGNAQLYGDPTYEDRKLYIFGAGEHHIFVNEICIGRKVLQMQAVFTFTDRLFAIITLGIYTPRSVLIWCASD